VYDHSDQAVFLIAVVETDSEEEGRGARDWFQETEALVLSLCSSTSAGISTTSAAGAAGCVATVLPKSDFAEPLQFVLERDRAAYEADVRQCLEHIASGESYEICLTNRLHTELPEALDVLDIYRTLRLVNPAPYAAFIRMSQDTAICCSSPERFLRAFADGRVESKPIKGTRPRSSSLAEDEALALDLRTSEKDCSENLMIVDLVRNDLGRTCAPGSIAVPVLMQVETYASVHQLVSTVRGRRRDSVSTMRCIREAYPMGSMTGAPKVRTMSLIDGLESSARGVYSGTIGYLSLCGAADMNVVIRTAVVSGRSVEIGVGGAIVALSSPEEEFAEILVKGRPIMQSIALVSTGLDVFDVRDSVLKAIPVGDGSSR
jgi:para-aminobenzoate synthetase